MKYTKELDKKQVKFTIDLTYEEWENELEHIYEHQKAKFNIEGFRKGKAPRKVIEKQYGESIFYNDAIEECFYTYFNQVMEKEQDVLVVGNPALDVKKLDNTGITLVVTMDLKPEIKLGDYKNLKVEKVTAKVTAEEVEKEIEKMVQKSARIVAVDREIKNGDTVVFDFTGYVDGKAFDGGHAENYELEIGSGRFIKGFEEGMLGLKAGEEKDINVTFPENYPVESLKGAPAVFKIKVHEVKEKILPQVDDEFAKNVSEFDTLDEYKKSVKEDLLKQKQMQADYEYEEKLIEAVTNNVEADIPESMINEQVDMFIHDFEHRLSHSGMNLDTYFEMTGSNLQSLKESRKEDAKKTCKTRLAMEKIVELENIKVEKEDIEKEIEKQALRTGTSVEDVKKKLDEHALGHIANNLIVEKLLNFLKENNK